MLLRRRPFQPGVFLAAAGIATRIGADEGLYRPKAEGKNRSVVYQAC